MIDRILAFLAIIITALGGMGELHNFEYKPTLQQTQVEIPADDLLKLPQTIVISAAGDFTLGGDVLTSGEKRFGKMYDTEGAEWFLRNVKEIFAADDFTVVNLETTLTDAVTQRPGRQFLFRGEEEYTSILTEGSVEIVSVANNHHNDFLSEGKEDTKAALTAADIAYFGYSDEYYTECKGVTLGFLGFTQWDITAPEVTERVTAAAEKCEILTVYFHWGEEYNYKPTNLQQTLGHAAVNAGADLVVGTHPHVVGEIENYNGVNIVYSLGNFCYGGHSDPPDYNTFIFQQTFTIEDGQATPSGSEVIECKLSSETERNNYQPTKKLDIRS
ncbi:MAG: CapA family protein [Ruminococcus sp.]|jgi:poly-gamma-glutamate synthesis protein (capsule biosynthesis protein)|nr:CapA family protein [Ruminococcus sp.]